MPQPVTEFRFVPEEIKAIVDSGIFWFAYTHVSGSSNRDGIAKTGKIMSLSLARDRGVIPFTGETLAWTFLFRMYAVSVSDYIEELGRIGPTDQRWANYIDYTKVRWTPEKSALTVSNLEEAIIAATAAMQADTPKGIEKVYPEGHIQRRTMKRKEIESYRMAIEFERERQMVYDRMSADERAALLLSFPDIYVFKSKLHVRRTEFLGQPVRIRHPYVPGEINLARYLVGMFTPAVEVEATREWITRVTGRGIPVASLDALWTWEQMIEKIAATESYANSHSLYHALIHDQSRMQQLRERVIAEIKSY